MLEENQVHENVCPFLGLRYDLETRYGFPNPGNHCHRETNPRAINLDYQQNVCLSQKYQNCPIYLQQNGHASGALIQNSRVQTISANGQKSQMSWGWVRFVIGIFLVVGSIAGMYFLVQQNASGGGSESNGTVPVLTENPGIVVDQPTDTPLPATETPTDTQPPTTFTPVPSATSTETALPTGTPLATGTNTATPTETNTPTATRVIFFPPATNTPRPSNTLLPTNTTLPPSNTPAPPTNTPIPPTNTPINDDPTETPTP